MSVCEYIQGGVTPKDSIVTTVTTHLDLYTNSMGSKVKAPKSAWSVVKCWSKF